MIDIEKDGIRSSFDVQAEMASKWTCGDRMVPHLPLNPTYRCFLCLDSSALCRNLLAMISTRTCSATPSKRTSSILTWVDTAGNPICSNSTPAISMNSSPCCSRNTTPRNQSTPTARPPTPA